jgi:hypothetical protein
MSTSKDRSDKTPPVDGVSILIAAPFIALMLYLLLRNKGQAAPQSLPRVPVERWKNWWPLDD